MGRRTRADGRWRLRAAVAAGLSLALLTVGWSAPADAEVVRARTLDRVCPAPGAGTSTSPAATFPDAGSTHGPAIRCAADYGLVTGFGDGTYRPGTALRRGQMATLLRRLIETATGEVLPVPAGDPFPDIAGGAHRDAIAALHAAGVLQGRADGRFDPGATVNRGQMARFLVNALDRIVDPGVTGNFPPRTDNVRFADVDGTTFQADIQALAAQGIVQGTAPSRYDPTAAVTRGQVATFLIRAADLLAIENAWLPTAVAQEPEPVLLDITVVLTGGNVVAPDDADKLVSGRGQPGARATAILVFDLDTERLSFAVDYAQLEGPFDAAAGIRLQRGAAGTNGSTVLLLASGPQLEADADRNIGGVLSGSDAAGNDVAAAIRAILADPAGHYLSIRSNAFSAGAVRGQLSVPR